MVSGNPIHSALQLNKPINEAEQLVFGSYHIQHEPRTPNEWFTSRFPEQVKIYGTPFLEMKETLDGFTKVTPLAMNFDFFAAALGGSRSLNHHVIYLEHEMQWYFLDVDGIYKTTTADKLMNLYRALLMKCAEELLSGSVDIFNLFWEFRSDRNCKTIIQRAKSNLAADQSFFSPTSPHQRIRGVELHERLILNLVETMLERSEGACLTVTQAYDTFCKLSQQRQLGQLKRSMFKEMMKDLIRDRFDLALRHDVPDAENKHQQAWRGLKLMEAEVLTA
jgi:hypothetical protein